MPFDIYPPASTGLTTSDLITQPQLPVLGVNTSSASVVTIGSLPSTYRMLRTWFHLIMDSNAGPRLRLNNDTSGTYRISGVGANGASASVWRTNANDGFPFPTVNTGLFWSGYIDIHDYSSSTTRKFISGIVTGGGSSTWGYEFTGSWVPGSSTSVTSVDWANTSGVAMLVSDFFVMGAK